MWTDSALTETVLIESALRLGNRTEGRRDHQLEAPFQMNLHITEKEPPEATGRADRRNQAMANRQRWSVELHLAKRREVADDRSRSRFVLKIRAQPMEDRRGLRGQLNTHHHRHLVPNGEGMGIGNPSDALCFRGREPNDPLDQPCRRSVGNERLDVHTQSQVPFGSLAVRGESQALARARHFAPDQGAELQEYRWSFEILQRRDGVKGPLVARLAFYLRLQESTKLAAAAGAFYISAGYPPE